MSSTSDGFGSYSFSSKVGENFDADWYCCCWKWNGKVVMDCFGCSWILGSKRFGYDAMKGILDLKFKLLSVLRLSSEECYW